MRYKTKINNIKEKCGLFQEFCEIKGLTEGDDYSPIDYIDFCNELTKEDILKITQKYEPNFKSENLGF